MGAADNSTVKITINVVDPNSDQVISTVTKNLGSLGDAGAKAGTQIAQGAQAGSVALRGAGDAGAVMGKSVADGGRVASTSLDAVATSASKVQQSMTAIPVAVEAAAKRTKAAGSEMQQMLENIQRAQKKLEVQHTNQWQGPLRKSNSSLADSFSDLGTAKGDMDGLGESFSRMGSKAEDALKKTGGHATSALDRVRLLSQEFGLRLPRALESMIARMPVAMAAIGGLGSAVAGLAIAEVFVRASMAIYDLEQKFFSIDAPAKAFYETLKKTSELDFSNTRNLATTQLRLGTSEQNNAALPKLAQASGRQGWVNLAQGDLGGAVAAFATGHSAAEAGASASGNVVSLTGKALEQTHAQALAQIEVNHALDGTLSRRAQIAAQVAKTAQIESENASFSRKQEMALGNPAPKDAGQLAAMVANQKAQREGAVQTIALNQEVTAAVMRSRDTAVQAGLQGEALYARKQKDAINELTAELAAQHMAEETPARTAALNEQYDNERLARARELTAETRRGTAEVELAGKKGIARVLAERDIAVGNIGAAEAKFSGGAPLSAQAKGDFDQQRVNAARTATTQMEEIEKQFYDRIRDLDDGRSDSSMSASQRIDASTRRAQQEISKSWEETYGKLAVLDLRRLVSYQALQAELGRIGAAGAREIQENREHIEDETRRMEAEGGRRGMTREQEEAQAVLDDYNERYRHLEDLRVKDAGNADLYRRQEIAAEEIKNGKLLEQQRAMRDKLAGIIRGYMNNPLEALKRSGEEATSKYAADLLLKASGRTGVGTGDAGAFGLGGLFRGGAGGSTRDAGHQGTVAASSSVSAASTEVRTSMATIYVQAATFASMPGGAGAALPASAIAAGGGAGGSGGGFGFPSSSTIDAGSRFAGGGSTTGGSGGQPSIFSDLSGMGQKAQETAKLGEALGIKTGDLGSKLGGKIGLSSSAMGKAGGAISGAAGLFSAFQGNGGLGGAFSGAVSGAQLGAQFGGPWGAAIGAAAGGIIGFLGFGGAGKARKYDETEVRPRIASDVRAFGMGTMDYSSAWEDLVKLDMEARQQTKQWGQGGKRQWDGSIHPAILAAQQQLTREQKAGRSQYGAAAAQFHNGGMIGDFGAMATTGDQGWVHAQRGEFMVQQQAVPSHFQALQLMQSGASHSDMANYYGAGAQGGFQPAAAGRDVTLNFHSHDAQGALRLFMDNKHMLREALDQSYLENSGGANG